MEINSRVLCVPISLSVLLLAACGGDVNLVDAKEQSLTEIQCPNVCEAVCSGEPEPEIPEGCAIPTCECS